mmetsp:Transcript_35777/g.64597  ORF Transcript_35777/g.64597 Transcript_35777/m.64597 type:complete len:240 (-) Transcript_35777:1345-2064(-)
MRQQPKRRRRSQRRRRKNQKPMRVGMTMTGRNSPSRRRHQQRPRRWSFQSLPLCQHLPLRPQLLHLPDRRKRLLHSRKRRRPAPRPSTTTRQLPTRRPRAAPVQGAPGRVVRLPKPLVLAPAAGTASCFLGVAWATPCLRRSRLSRQSRMSQRTDPMLRQHDTQLRQALRLLRQPCHRTARSSVPRRRRPEEAGIPVSLEEEIDVAAAIAMKPRRGKLCRCRVRTPSGSLLCHRAGRRS